MFPDLEWVESTNSVELRWGVRRSKGLALRGSTRIALVQQDPEFKGDAAVWRIQPTLLFEHPYYSKDYATKELAKHWLVKGLNETFQRMADVTNTFKVI